MPGRVLHEAFQADRLEVAVEIGDDRPGPRRVPVDDPAEDLGDRVPLEGRAARQQLVEGGAQAIDVGGCRQVLRPAPGLLGGHVRRRPHHGAGDRRRRALRRPRADPLRQAEVGHERLVALAQEDVRRLEVAVEDRPLVRVVDRPRHLGHQRGDGPRVALQPADVSRQVAALDQPHAEERLVVDLADLVDRHDVRVVELRHRLGLGAEPPQLGEARQRRVADQLQRHEPPEVDLPRPVDDPHPAPSDLVDQLVFAEEPRRPRGGRRGRLGLGRPGGRLGRGTPRPDRPRGRHALAHRRAGLRIDPGRRMGRPEGPLGDRGGSITHRPRS